MKRIAVITLGLLSLGVLLYAQTGDSPRQDNRRLWRQEGFLDESRPAEKLNLSGTLGLSRGIIVLKSGEQTWYVPELRRFTGFIEGMKEGAAVTLEGWGRKVSRLGENAGFLRVSKMTLNGKDYELGPAEPGMARGPGSPMGRDFFGGPGHHGWGRQGPMMRPRDQAGPRRHFRFHGPRES
jgi:hypothetical protein